MTTTAAQATSTESHMDENYGTSDMAQLERIIARGEANRLARK